jgi:hypothetical protein
MSHAIANTEARAALLGDDSEELEIDVKLEIWIVEIPFERGSHKGTESYLDAEITEATHKGKPLPFELSNEEQEIILRHEVRRITETTGLD